MPVCFEDVMRFWLNMGCDGFRVDMAGSLVKNDQEGKGTIRLWQQVRKFLDACTPLLRQAQAADGDIRI